jgi:hypothetical protein
MGIPKPFLDFYTHMFIQDLSVALLPIGGRSKRSGFSVELVPENVETEQMLVSAIARNHYSHSFAGTLGEFFRLAGAEMCAFDQAIYEVTYFEDRDTKKPEGFELFFINREQIVARKGKIYQTVPSAVAKERNVPELIDLPCENLIIFTPPPHLRRPLRNVRQDLSRLSDLRFPRFALDAEKNNVPYDFKVHDRSMKLALIEAAKPVGWIARGLFNDQVLSYYWIKMRLKFESVKIELRDTMLATLNDGLRRIGERMGFKATIVVKGVPTLRDVADALQKLNTGEVPFTKVMDVFYD